jgi:hypothetical protein
MKQTCWVLFAFIFVQVARVQVSHYEAAAPYFGHVRDVTIASSERQHYVVVDANIWAHSRADLADVRLYDGQTQVP